MHDQGEAVLEHELLVGDVNIAPLPERGLAQSQ
jgi:hypothetical protein